MVQILVGLCQCLSVSYEQGIDPRATSAIYNMSKGGDAGFCAQSAKGALAISWISAGWRPRNSRPSCLSHSQVLMGAGLAGRPPCLPHSQVLMGAGLAGRPPCLPHSQVLMGAGLAGRPPCLPHSQVLMGAGLAGRPPCLPHSQALMAAGFI